MSTLSTEELKKLTEFQRPSDIERCLQSQGIAYFSGRSGPWTTLDLVNAAGGLKVEQKPAAYSSDLIP